MIDPLTNREEEILQLISEGLTNQEIADRLYLSRGTIKAHNHNIYSKLGVSNRTQALLRAQEIGLLDDAAIEDHQEDSVITDDLTTIPTPLSPLVGREFELTKLQKLIVDPEIRLVTLLGTGGMGKTRMSIELAHAMKSRFKDGVFFVSLAQITDEHAIAATIIDEMQIQIHSHNTAEEKLISFLKKREILLVLDNFEHLLDGVSLLIQLLSEAPALTLLVTSRERLNLTAEIVYVLGGLDYGTIDQNEAFENNPAAELFIGRAKFINPNFTVQDSDRDAIQTICELTQGMPLALILASSWLDVLTLPELVTELTKSIDILDSQLRDLPARQRSMRAMITTSWNRLTDSEKQIFASLTVFRHGFTREAASAVARVGIRELHTLVNRSLLSIVDGRYTIHELLRQFVAEKTDLYSQQLYETRQLHCEYFAQMMQDNVNHNYISNEKKQEFIKLTIADFNNILLAWHWAIEQENLDALEKMVRTLASFCHMQSRFLEGFNLFNSAVKKLKKMPQTPQTDLLMAIMYTDMGWYHMRFSSVTVSSDYFVLASNLFEKLNHPPLHTTTDPKIGLAFVELIEGNYDLAAKRAETAVEECTVRNDDSNLAYAFYALTGIKLAQGEYDSATHYGEKAVALSREIGDTWLCAYCLTELGNVMIAINDMQAAKKCLLESYEIKKSMQEPQGTALNLAVLGTVALQENDLDQAESYLQESKVIYDTIHDQGGYATVLHGMGKVMLLRHNDLLFQQYIVESLQMANEINYVHLIFDNLLQIAMYYIKVENIVRGVTLLQYIATHPNANDNVRQQAQQTLLTYEDVSPDSSLENQPLSDVVDIIISQIEVT